MKYITRILVANFFVSVWWVIISGGDNKRANIILAVLTALVALLAIIFLYNWVYEKLNPKLPKYRW